MSRDEDNIRSTKRPAFPGDPTDCFPWRLKTEVAAPADGCSAPWAWEDTESVSFLLSLFKGIPRASGYTYGLSDNSLTPTNKAVLSNPSAVHRSQRRLLMKNNEQTLGQCYAMHSDKNGA